MSITIIDGTAPPAPMYVREPKPDFSLSKHPEKDLLNYYDTWYQRWWEGYKGLTGPHVFYIQEVMLKDIFGNIYYPHWRDLDSLVFGQIKECMDARDDGLWYKARDKGLTSIFGAGMTMWFARMYPGIKINLTGKDKDNIVNMYEDKIMVAYENMDPYIMNVEPTNINRTKQQVYLKITLKKRLDSGEIKKLHTELNLMSTSETDSDVAKFSGTRSPYSYIDEAPLHKKIAQLIRSSEATRMKGATKAGFLAMAGTVEDTLTKDELVKFWQLIQDAKTKGIRTFFVPAWMGLPEYSVNGWSDEKRGTEWVLSMLEKKKQSSDPNDAIAWRKNYPLYEDDIFDLSQGGGLFEQDVMDILEHGLKRLMEQPKNPESQYKLIPGIMGLEAVPDSHVRTKDDGGFWIIEPPVDGQEYYISVDGAGSGKEDGAEEGSWIASIVWKGISLSDDHYAPVCIYTERPNRLEDGYRNIVNQLRFYDKFGGVQHINYETNAGVGGNFGTYLDGEGLYKKIMKRRDLTGKGFINTNKVGTAVDTNVYSKLVKLSNIFLRKYCSTWNSRMVYTALLAASGANSDIRSAFLIFMASIEGLWNKPKKVERRQVFRTVFDMKKVNGKNMLVQRQVPLLNQIKEHDPVGSELQVLQNQLHRKYGANWFANSTVEERKRWEELKENVLGSGHKQ